MGKTQCFKANVAFSLYGVLKGSNSGMSRGSYCHSGSYINSFFTTFGVESFAGPLGLGVDTANSYCTNEEGDGDGDQDWQDAVADDDYLDDGFNYYNYHTYSSYGTGCSADGKFVTDSYNGAFCHGSNYKETLNTLDSFNEAMETLECSQIYSASNDNNNDNQNRRRAEENEGYNFEEMNAIQILSFSKSCSLSQYPQDCPDPYGKKKKWSAKIERALEYKTGKNRDAGTKAMRAFAYLSLIGGLAFLVATFAILRRRKRLMMMKRRLAGSNRDDGKGRKKKTKDSRSQHKKDTPGTPVAESTEKTLNEFEMASVRKPATPPTPPLTPPTPPKKDNKNGTEAVTSLSSANVKKLPAPRRLKYTSNAGLEPDIDHPSVEVPAAMAEQVPSAAPRKSPDAMFPDEVLQILQAPTKDSSEGNAAADSNAALPPRRLFVFPLRESQVEAVFENSKSEDASALGEEFDDKGGPGTCADDVAHKPRRRKNFVLASDEEVEAALDKTRAEHSESSDSYEMVGSEDIVSDISPTGQDYVFSLGESRVEAALEGETCNKMICELYMKKNKKSG